MSPSEADLRAALHDGEGDDVDVCFVLAGGRRRVAQRRQRLRSVAVGTVVVAGLVTGGTYLFTRSTGVETSTTSGAAAGAGTGFNVQNQSQAGSQTGPGLMTGDAAAQTTSSSAAENQGIPASGAGPCPSSPPALPSTAARTGGALFAKPVFAALVCAYRPGVSAVPTTVVLRDSQARALVASLEQARTTPVPGACPAYVLGTARVLRIVARATDDSTLPTVVASLNQPACRSTVSNGTATRYGWSPPKTLDPLLQSLVK